ncbi:MAG: hypothetical protein HY323_14435 [Betaproteobacteria bacterium]|nr:hypothetical protein [Betaproteobacteria bacterium]
MADDELNTDFGNLVGGDEGLNTDFGNLIGGGDTIDWNSPWWASDIAASPGGDQWFYDTQTGQIVNAMQAQALDPTFTTYDTFRQPTMGGADTGGGTDWLTARNILGGASALGGLGMLGLGIGSLFGGNDAASRTSTQTATGGQGPRSAEAMALLGGVGQPGGPGGAPDAPGSGLLGLGNLMMQNLGGSGLGEAPAPAPGLLSAPGSPGFNEATGQYAPGREPPGWIPGATAWQMDQMGAKPVPGGGQPAPTWTPPPGRDDLSAPTSLDAMGNLARPAGGLPMTGAQLRTLAAGQQWAQPPQQGQPGQPGLIGQQSQLLGGLQNQIPQLNPLILQALGAQAGGMAQGYLPSLNDPQAQARIQSIYQPGFDALNYNAGLALQNAREQLQQRGFQAPDIREGPTQALTAPILAAQQLGRSQLYGQMAGAQLDLASRLPMLGAQLAAQQYGLQQQPFNMGLQLAGAYNQPIATQGQFPLSLFDIMERGRGSTQTVNTVGPQPSLTQSLGQIAPVIGGAGGLLGTAGNVLWPPQQVGLSGLLGNQLHG